ncbi:DUF3810 family protein [Flavobacteriaceae bacterium Ap0902]|nr:DUF3810 family protein [Flavobacteriaceae bacterium Ap0902]
MIYLIIKVLSNVDIFVNVLYPDFYRMVYPSSTLIFGWIPFSIGDLIYMGLGFHYIFCIYKIVKYSLLKMRWRAIRLLSHLIYITTMLVVIFNVFWGFNYDRKNLIEQYQIEPYDIEELKGISNYILGNAIKYRTQVEEDSRGVFQYDMRNFETGFQGKIFSRTDLPYTTIPSNSKKKYSLLSWVMRYFGVSGYYNPFTAESQITRLTPSVSMPFAMAHEQAHQMGYAPEFEANYIGYITCIETSDSGMNYSGKYKALKYLLRAIYPHDSAYVKSTLDSFSPGMKRDYMAEKEFHQKYAGQANEMFSSLNHVYLKANKQNKGIQSYNQFVDLLVHYYRVKKTHTEL